MNVPKLLECGGASHSNAERSAEGEGISHSSFQDRKQLSTLRARAALCGLELRLTSRRDGPTTCAFDRMGESHVFTHAHDIEAFLARVGGSR